LALIPGTRLGAYEIVAQIGAGGMGEVYKATDTNLKRAVALKVLPALVAADAERLARFQREAEVLAALNHPHIAAIYGLERSGATTALVMELVEGEDLSTIIAGDQRPPEAESGSSRLRDGASAAGRGGGAPRHLSLDDALPIARQIADALEAAHEQGIIHRDLKPANIKVRADGTVKVLDFGLAKAMDPVGAMSSSASMSPTLTSPAMTQAGMILGTAAYMSPEQAKGRAVDKRTDVWAFGAVLYEMLSGQRAFEGDDVTETMARILMKEPDWAALPATVPPAVVNVLRRCLEKDRKQRVRDIGDVALALEGAFDTPRAPQTIESPASGTRGWLGWVVAGLATVLLAVLAVIHYREVPAATPLVQTEMPLPDEVVPSYGSISPDGTRLVMRGTPPGGRPQLYLRSLSGRAFAPIPGSENTRSAPFWSPDSHWIAFSVEGKLMKWDVTGGQPPQLVCNADADFGAWSDDGVILFSEEDKPIQRVSATGGTARNALELDKAFGETAHLSPFFLPGGQAFLFGSNGKVRGAHFFTTLDGKMRHRLPDNLNGPNRWVANASGGAFLAYTSRNQLFVRPFNSGTGEFSGEAVLLVDEVVNGPTFSFGGAGALVYTPNRTASAQLRWYGADHKRGDVLGEPGQLGNPQLSPDGKRVLFLKQDAGKREIWVVPAGGGVGERVASMAQNLIGAAIWTPDGRMLYSRRDDTGAAVIERPADALGSDSVLARLLGNTLPALRSISADGKVIAMSASGGGANDVSLLSRPGGKVRPASGSAGNVAILSPDGRWLAYRANAQADPNTSNVFVRAVPEDPEAPLPSGERQIFSLAMPVQQLRWSDRNQLLILVGPTPEQRVLMALPLNWTDGTPRPGALQKLFDAPKAVSFDVTADGRRFIVAETVGENAIAPLVLVQNWPALLQK